MLYKQINKKLVPVYVGEDSTDAYQYNGYNSNGFLPEIPDSGYRLIQDGYEVIDNCWVEKWIQVECKEQVLLREKNNQLKNDILNYNILDQLENANIRNLNSLIFQLAQYLNVGITDLSFATEEYKNNLLLRITEAIGIPLASTSVVDINSTDNLILEIGKQLGLTDLPSDLTQYTINQKIDLVRDLFIKINPALKNKFLCFTAEEAGSTISMRSNGAAPTVYLETSLTGEDGTWSDFIVNSTVIVLYNVGDKVYFRAKQDNHCFATNSDNYNNFIMSGKISAFGNINTLLKADDSILDLTGRSHCYSSMFSNCSSLTQAPELPATTLAESCYYGMFSYCTSLTQAPKLPATTLANYCYSRMFRNCSSLTQAPELPATTLANYCYSRMFFNCTSLTQAPELPATTLADYCYYDMFYNCSSLTQAPALPATTLANSCYNDMFSNCTSLTQAPELPATTLADYCYDDMFYNCTSLTQAPELPATTLASYCYRYMFANCTSLTNINVSFTAWSPSDATLNWVIGVKSTGTFTCPSTLPANRGTPYIPNGWTIVRK